jgi:hypothetical protein
MLITSHRSLWHTERQKSKDPVVVRESSWSGKSLMVAQAPEAAHRQLWLRCDANRFGDKSGRRANGRVARSGLANRDDDFAVRSALARRVPGL